ncbi:hypothetical protein [Paenibacillus sp. 3LSP]|nr:hypothetical protein [Paenibacillus sp. 3LSP]
MIAPEDLDVKAQTMTVMLAVDQEYQCVLHVREAATKMSTNVK